MVDLNSWGRGQGEKMGQNRIRSALAEAELEQSAVQSVTFLTAIVAWGFGLY